MLQAYSKQAQKCYYLFNKFKINKTELKLISSAQGEKQKFKHFHTTHNVAVGGM